ncbi:unnamed protein product [Porites lobata]|uniref:ZZ-type domain-containing protein n=1 Tax=Porites lobata TaxID=104759 RepID=A0ABN8QS80_9CNID|nr:unnamed protein product [Porites lobata]
MLLFSATPSRTKHMDEQEEFEQYEEHIKWLELAKEDIATWISCVQTEAQTDQQRKRTHLFLVRFSNMLGMSLNCTGCGITWDKGKDFWGCLNCPNVNLCGSCNLCGVNPDGHSETHDTVYLRVWCDGCGGCIVGTRYHCSECKEMNLCTGCHFSGKFPERHIVTHNVTKYSVLVAADGFSVPSGTKNTDEQQELQHYEENMKWVEDAKKDFNAWRSGVWKKVVTNHHLRRVLLFLARFSHVIGGTKICDGCGTDLVKGTRQFFCLTCLKVILCNSCHESGEKPERHLKTHDILGMRFLCESCDSYIVGARYHCGECKNGVDLCTGCYSSGKFPKGHTANHEMTKFPPETASEVNAKFHSEAHDAIKTR